MCALVTALRKIPLYGPGGGGPAAGDKANPTYSVAISDDVAQKNKDSFNEEQDKKRLVPLLPQNKGATSPSKTESASADYGTATGVETREAAAVDHLVRRDIAVDPQEILDQDRELALNRNRSNDVDEVRDILRRQSTTGRRRAARHGGLSVHESADARAGSRTIPTIPEPSPQVPLDASHGDRTHYFEDTNQATTYPSTSQQAWTTVAPLNYNQFPTNVASPQAARPTSPATTWQAPSTSSPGRYVPGNAFSQQARSPQHLPRVPVPGMPEMKRTLQHGQSPPSE